MSNTLPSGEDHNQDPQHEILLNPEAMFDVAVQLLDGFEVEFPEIGAIPVKIDTPDPEKPGAARFFQIQKEGKSLYVPGEGERRILDGAEPRTDFTGGFVQAFGKVVTIRMRGDVPAPQPDRHKEVPKLARVLVDPAVSIETAEWQGATDTLRGVIAHNLGEVGSNADSVNRAVRAHLWMVGRLRSLIEGQTAR